MVFILRMYRKMLILKKKLYLMRKTTIVCQMNLNVEISQMNYSKLS